MMFQIARRSTASVAQKLSVRAFSAVPARRNLVSDLYVSELKKFKPTAASASEAAAATKAWNLPVTPKAPEIEGDITTDIAAYEATEVETESAAPVEEGAEPVSEDWFVVEEVKPTHH